MSNSLQILTSTEENKLLNFLHSPTDTRRMYPRHYRDLCMVLLMLDAGLRVGEVTKLLITDLAIEGLPVLNLCITADIAKNKHRRIVPCTQRISIATSYMIVKVWTDTHLARSPFAFESPDYLGHLSTRQVRRIVKRAAIASIGRPIHPHVLRHTFATKLLSVTNIRVVQKLLGHTQLSSTMIYTHPNDQDLREAIDKLS